LIKKDERQSAEVPVDQRRFLRSAQKGSQWKRTEKWIKRTTDGSSLSQKEEVKKIAEDFFFQASRKRSLLRWSGRRGRKGKIIEASTLKEETVSFERFFPKLIEASANRRNRAHQNIKVRPLLCLDSRLQEDGLVGPLLEMIFL